MEYHIDIDHEIEQIRGVIPGVTKEDFYELDNENIGVIVYFETDSGCPEFEVLIEYTPGYPDKPPNAWVLSPSIDSSSPHVWTRENGDAKICFIKPPRWESNWTSYDVAGMIKSWIFAYCKWKKTGEWGWDEVGLVGHFI